MNSQNPAVAYQGFIDAHKAYVANHKAYVDSIVPFRDRFFSFLAVNGKKVANFVDFNFDLEEHSVAPRNFDVSNDPAENAAGIYFFFDAFNGHEIDSLYFTMPFEYMSDPAGWEKRTLAENEDLRVAVSEAYFAEVSEMKGTGVKVCLNDEKQERGVVSGFIQHPGEVGYSMFHPNREKLVFNLFGFDIAKGEFTTRLLR